MTISTFDIQNGAYAFAENTLNTIEHHHPALEIIIANTGTFELVDATGETSTLTAAVIPANTPHKVNSHDTPCEIWMFENEKAVMPLLEEALGAFDPRAAILTVSEVNAQRLTPMFFQLLKFANAQYNKGDKRVKTCKKYVFDHYSSPTLNRDELAAIADLSPSRFSHLFKSEVGVSIKHYIIWTRLKHAIQATLEQEFTLLEAGYTAGFYDLAHFSKAFLRFFGVNPSFAYNKRTLWEER